MKSHILAFDDSEDCRGLVSTILGSEFEVTTLNDASHCIEDVKNKRPDLILLDIMMPALNGYDACKQLKSSNDTSDIPIIFLSALDKPQDRIEGYACGAEDFISKPFDSKEMLCKINMALDNAKEHKMLKDQYQAKQHSEELALNAIEQLYEFGALMDFHRRSSACVDYDTLGEAVLRTCRKLGLAGSLEIAGRAGNHYYGCEADSLEAQLLARCIDQQTNIHVKNRSVFKRSNTALLIKNMPFEAVDRYGRFKDNLQILINSASDHISMIDLQNRNENVADAGFDAERLRNFSARLKQALATQSKETNAKISKLFWTIEDRLLGLGLEDDQEKKLLEILRESEKSLEGLFEESGSLELLMDEISKM